MIDYKAKTKPLISCAVTAQLICGFVFAYTNCCVCHALAHLKTGQIFFLARFPLRKSYLVVEVAVKFHKLILYLQFDFCCEGEFFVM